MKKYFSLVKEKETATLNIFGDITSFPWKEGDVSNANLSKQLEAMKDVKQINVYINSYGGEVAEGLAIYNALKRHSAKVVTHCDGFACSIASVIFMAGDERIMNEASLLMIHNAWSWAEGNAAQLRKQADDLEKITQASVKAYVARTGLSEEKVKSLMDAETWLLPDEAKELGFATKLLTEKSEKASQSSKMSVLDIFKKYRAELEEDDEEEPEEPETEDGEEPEGEPEPEEEPEEAEGEDEPEEEPPADDDEEEPEDEETNEPEKEAAQLWEGFFNALLK